MYILIKPDQFNIDDANRDQVFFFECALSNGFSFFSFAGAFVAE